MTKESFFHIENRKYMTAWILITACFALWGYANNVTTPMVNAFSKIFRISTTEASLVPVVFNLGYFCLAFPAAMFIQKYTYKWGIIVGLVLFAVGALFFIPARWIGSFYPFLSSYFVLTCGSRESRNYRLGELLAAEGARKLGEKKIIKRFLRENTVEGVFAAREIERTGVFVPREAEILTDSLRRIKDATKR